MPRTERPLDDDGSPLVEFASDLRKLRTEAGSPPYRELARKAHYSSTTLSDAAAGRQLPSLAVALAYVEACDGDRDEWERRWHEVAADLNGRSVDVQEPSGNAPYVGLAAYSPDDAELFFGRERLVQDLRARLRLNRFLAVFGPSGAGKSSTLRAGLIPALRADSPLSPIVLFTPGAHPLREWAIHLASLLGATAPAVERDLAAGPLALRSLIEQLLADHPAGAEVVFVIDQFEEVFTLCPDLEERQAFLSLLLDAGQRCRVVVGVRADFYAHCALHPELAEALQDAQVTVGPMTADELRRAITRPARLVGCAVESDLLSVLVAHAHGQAGSLPLLSHALLQTWRRRKGNTLTLVGFQATGGFAGALARTAETVFGAMTTQQQHLAQHLFRRLIALGDGTEDTKRRVRRAELDDTPDVDEMLHTLSDARLLTLDRDTVEITHEALIGGWPRLRRWLSADREGHRLHRELTDAAVVWQSHDRDPSTLLRGNRLTLVADWAADGAGLTELEQSFLEASAAAQQREHTSTRRQIRRQRVLIAVLTVLVLSVTAALIFASNAQKNATEQRNTALALRAAPVAVELSNKDPQRAAKLALAAYRLHPSEETEGAVIATVAALSGIQLKYFTVEISRDARILASADLDSGRTTLFSITEDGLREESSVSFTGREETRLFPSFSPGNRVLLSAGENGAFTVWDITDLRTPVRKSALPGVARVSDWSPDGRYVLTVDYPQLPANESEVSKMWDLGDPANPALVATLPGDRPKFAGSSGLVATMTRRTADARHPDTVALYRVLLGTGAYEPVTTIRASRTGFADMAFSEDGRRATLLESQIGEFGDTHQFLSEWRTEPGRSAELVEEHGLTLWMFHSLVPGRGGAYPPALMIQTDGRIMVWDSRDPAAERPVLSLPLGGLADTTYVNLEPSWNQMFLITRYGDRNEFRRLELDIAKSASKACRGGADSLAADVWAEHFPGVKPFPLCP